MGSAAAGRGRQSIHNFGSRLSLLLGVDCSLGCCCISAYTFSVWFGCFAFVLWGCYCDDPEQGYANDWNRVYHPKGLDDDGHYVHRCAVHFAAALGLEWCVAVGCLVAAYADTYVPEAPYCTYGLRVPASCVPYVPEAQGSLLPGHQARHVRRTRTSPTCRTCRVPWHRGTVAPQVAANLYFSLPVLGFLVWYYGWRLAGKSLALGFFAAAGLVAILFVVVDGADPPPGFGISGVPLGGCAVAYAARGSSNPGLAESGQARYSRA